MTYQAHVTSRTVFGLPPAIVAATLGQIGVEEVVSLAEKVIDSLLKKLYH